MYDLYSFQVIPVMGHLVSGKWQHYQYLVESIRQFPNQVCVYSDFKKVCTKYEELILTLDCFFFNI